MIDISNSEILSLSMKHNFWTWSAQAHVDPIPIERAENVYFWDTDGKRYIDFNSLTMCSNIGHGDHRVIRAIQAQAEELTNAGPKMATKPRAYLGKLLADITPGNLNRSLGFLARFYDTGQGNVSADRVHIDLMGLYQIIFDHRAVDAGRDGRIIHHAIGLPFIGGNGIAAAGRPSDQCRRASCR